MRRCGSLLCSPLPTLPLDEQVKLNLDWCLLGMEEVPCGSWLARTLMTVAPSIFDVVVPTIIYGYFGPSFTVFYILNASGKKWPRHTDGMPYVAMRSVVMVIVFIYRSLNLRTRRCSGFLQACTAEEEKSPLYPLNVPNSLHRSGQGNSTPITNHDHIVYHILLTSPPLHHDPVPMHSAMNPNLGEIAPSRSRA